MQLKITGKHRNISDSLKIYIDKKVTELTHFYDRILDANVVLEKENINHVVTIKLRVAGQMLKAENRSNNLRAAIDACIDKLEKQLVKYKEKWQRKGPRVQEVLSVDSGSSVEDEEPELVGEQGAVLIFEEEDQSENSKKTGT